MNEANMISVLMYWAMEDKQHEVVLPNTRHAIGWWNWESDLVSATKSWLVHEFEVKISASDYLADFKKTTKHWALEKANERGAPNYFWYAMPLDLIDVESLTVNGLHPFPQYAGVIGVHYRPGRFGWRVRVLRPAPRLHVRKLSPEQRERCLRLASFRIKKLYRKFYWPEAPNV